MACCIFLTSFRILEEFWKNSNIKIPPKSPCIKFRSLAKFKNPILIPKGILSWLSAQSAQPANWPMRPMRPNQPRVAPSPSSCPVEHCRLRACTAVLRRPTSMHGDPTNSRARLQCTTLTQSPASSTPSNSQFLNDSHYHHLNPLSAASPHHLTTPIKGRCPCRPSPHLGPSVSPSLRDRASLPLSSFSAATSLPSSGRHTTAQAR
jgi:hypothetical protein